MQARQINNHVEAHVLPQRHAHNGRQGLRFVYQKGLGRNAHSLQQAVDDAVAGVIHEPPQYRRNRQRHHHRHQRRRAHQANAKGAPVDQQGQPQRERQLQGQFGQHKNGRDLQRIEQGRVFQRVSVVV